MSLYEEKIKPFDLEIDDLFGRIYDDFNIPSSDNEWLRALAWQESLECNKVKLEQDIVKQKRKAMLQEVDTEFHSKKSAFYKSVIRKPVKRSGPEVS